LFNLMVKGSGWSPDRDTFPLSRIFEYTEAQLVDRFMPNGQIDLAALQKLPTIFVEESYRDSNQVAHVGIIVRAHVSGRDVALEYAIGRKLRTRCAWSDSRADPLRGAKLRATGVS
jgi:hypothetical protein